LPAIGLGLLCGTVVKRQTQVPKITTGGVHIINGIAAATVEMGVETNSKNVWITNKKDHVTQGKPEAGDTALKLIYNDTDSRTPVVEFVYQNPHGGDIYAFSNVIGRAYYEPIVTRTNGIWEIRFKE